jgi:hypothetical protein
VPGQVEVVCLRNHWSSTHITVPAVQVRYLGTGGLIGIIAAMTEQADPYHMRAKGVANGLKRGPVLFYFPRALLYHISAGAANNSELRQLELDLYRSYPLGVHG